MKTLMLCGVVSLLTAHLSAAPLVKDGQALGEFIVSADGAAAETFAAKDVCDWIEKITGARVVERRRRAEPERPTVPAPTRRHTSQPRGWQIGPPRVKPEFHFLEL